MKKVAIIIVLLLIALVSGFYFRNDLLNIVWKFKTGLEGVTKTDFESIIQEFKREVFAPSPLRVDGPERQVVLVKERVIAHTNIQRFNHGLSPLIEQSQLGAAAMAKAQDMFNNQYFDHVSPAGLGPGELVALYGYDFIITGENLILGNFASEEEMVEAWMNSPGHRANILNKRFEEIGVTVLRGSYQGQMVWIGVQQFGLPLSACRTPSEDVKNQIEANKEQINVLEGEIAAKKSEIERTNPRSPRYNAMVDEYNRLVGEYNALVHQTKNLVFVYNQEAQVFNQCVEGS